MKVIGFKPEEIQTVYKILAAILHLVSKDSQSTLYPCGYRVLFQKILFLVKSNLCCENFACVLKNVL